MWRCGKGADGEFWREPIRSPEGSQWAFLVKVVRVFVKDNVNLVTKGI